MTQVDVLATVLARWENSLRGWPREEGERVKERRGRRLVGVGRNSARGRSLVGGGLRGASEGGGGGRVGVK